MQANCRQGKVMCRPRVAHSRTASPQVFTRYYVHSKVTHPAGAPETEDRPTRVSGRPGEFRPRVAHREPRRASVSERRCRPSSEDRRSGTMLLRRDPSTATCIKMIGCDRQCETNAEMHERRLWPGRQCTRMLVSLAGRHQLSMLLPHTCNAGPNPRCDKSMLGNLGSKCCSKRGNSTHITADVHWFTLDDTITLPGQRQRSRQASRVTGSRTALWSAAPC